MILSLLSLINGLFVAENAQPVHSAPLKISRKIYLQKYKYTRRPKSRRAPQSGGEILSKKIEKPWNGHFSAKNFRKTTSDNSSLAEIKESLKTSILALPKWHTKSLKDLEIKNENNISRGLSSSSKIILHTSSIQSSQELIAVFIHEMGHITDLGSLKGKNGYKTAFYDGKTPILNDDLSLIFYKISWKNSSTQKKSAKNSDFVSGYAQSDVFEDFAETYLFYKLHGDKFRGILNKSTALKKKYEFMKKHVFNGQEFQSLKYSNINFPYQNIFDATLLNFDEKSL